VSPRRTKTALALSMLAAALVTPTAAWSGVSPASARPVIDVQPGGAASAQAERLPRFNHVLLVIFENKNAGSILGNPAAPYFNRLAAGGATFTHSYAVTHPSQPNYLALFSGWTHGVDDDSCPHTFYSENQAAELIRAGYTFTSYSENLPSAGSKVCISGSYARRHAPWANFPNVPKHAQQPFGAFPSHYSRLPDVAWVVPNVCHDMHDCSIATGNSWLRAHLGGYAAWAKQNNSLLIVTFDEAHGSPSNQIATIFYGAHVKPGRYGVHVTHYGILRTIEDMYGVPRLGRAREAQAITSVWK
jgi:phosphatidylinositol-3-phosphatase